MKPSTPFQQTLAKSSWPTGMVAAPECNAWCDIAALRDYRALLERARDQKSRTKHADPAMDAAVRTSARSARDAARRLTTSLLVQCQQLRTTEAFQTVFEAVAQHKHVDLAAEMQSVASGPAIRKALDAHGAPRWLLDDVAKAAKATGFTLEAKSADLLLAGSVLTQKPVGLRLRSDQQLTQKTIKTTSVGELLGYGQFDRLVAQFQQGRVTGPASLGGADPSDVDLFDAIGVGAVGLLAEFERHLRKLECSGTLDTHQGGDPYSAVVVIIVAIIAAAALLLTASALGIACLATGERELCDAAAIVGSIGILALAVGLGTAAGLLDPALGIFVGLGIGSSAISIWTSI